MRFCRTSSRMLPRIVSCSRVATFVVMAALLAVPETAAGIELTIDAPPSLMAVATRIRNVDEQPLADALARAGLELPPRVHVTLISENDPRVRDTSPWIVGQAFG